MILVFERNYFFHVYQYNKKRIGNEAKSGIICVEAASGFEILLKWRLLWKKTHTFMRMRTR